MGPVTVSTYPKARGIFDSEEALPIAVAELTPAWFSKVLGHEVTEVAIRKELHGTASKILVQLTYAQSDGAPPALLCVKGGFNPELIKMHKAILACYRLEAQFYYHLAPEVAMNLPIAYFCGTDRVNGQGLVVMEDLTASHCTFDSGIETWPVKRVRLGVAQLAALHSRTWGKRAAEFNWCSESTLRDAIDSLWAPARWQERYFTDLCPPIHEELKDRPRVISAYRTLWGTPDPRFQVIVHGDSHLGNTYVTASGQPGFLDWQVPHPNSAFHDIAYFITGALSIEDRRLHERDLVQHYLDTLASIPGGQQFAIEDVWGEFSRQQLYGFVWSLTPPIMQPRAVVDAYSERHATAIKDHRSLELIEAQAEYKRLDG